LVCRKRADLNVPTDSLERDIVTLDKSLQESLNVTIGCHHRERARPVANVTVHELDATFAPSRVGVDGSPRLIAAWVKGFGTMTQAECKRTAAGQQLCINVPLGLMDPCPQCLPLVRSVAPPFPDFPSGGSKTEKDAPRSPLLQLSNDAIGGLCITAVQPLPDPLS
jgi:hypothetical protein